MYNHNTTFNTGGQQNLLESGPDDGQDVLPVFAPQDSLVNVEPLNDAEERQTPDIEINVSSRKRLTSQDNQGEERPSCTITSRNLFDWSFRPVTVVMTPALPCPFLIDAKMLNLMWGVILSGISNNLFCYVSCLFLFCFRQRCTREHGLLLRLQ